MGLSKEELDAELPPVEEEEEEKNIPLLISIKGMQTGNTLKQGGKNGEEE